MATGLEYFPGCDYLTTHRLCKRHQDDRFFSSEGHIVSDPQTNPFVGANGEPLLRNGITAFLDILGFSQFCGEHTEIDKAQDLLQRIANAISNARNFLLLASGFTGLSEQCSDCENR